MAKLSTSRRRSRWSGTRALRDREQRVRRQLELRGFGSVGDCTAQQHAQALVDLILRVRRHLRDRSTLAQRSAHLSAASSWSTNQRIRSSKALVDGGFASNT